MGIRKDAFYFSHDSNARNDPKMIRLRRLSGLSGYGLFWCVVEMLRDADKYRLPLSIIDDMIFEFRSDPQTFEFIFECDLLKRDADSFWSESLIERMRSFEEKKIQAKAAGKASAQKRLNNRIAQVNETTATVEHPLNYSSTDAQPKRSNNITSNIKDSCVSDNPKEPKTEKRNEYSPEFEEFWKTYPRSIDKTRAFKTWNARIKEGALPDEIIAAASIYASDCDQKRTEEKYIKHPATFLNPDWREWIDKDVQQEPSLDDLEKMGYRRV